MTAQTLEVGSSKHFVLCFSAFEDNFGMWRKFSSEYCLTFRSSDLVNGLAVNGGYESRGIVIGASGDLNSEFMPVRYVRQDDVSGRAEIVKEIVAKVGQAFPTLGCENAALSGMASVKDAVFSSDAEWRSFYHGASQPGIGPIVAPARVNAAGKNYVPALLPNYDSLVRVTAAPGHD